MMLCRSSSTPSTSPNLWIVVIMIFRAPWLRSVCSSLRESAETSPGTSDALNVPVICVSRSMRSTTIRIVGLVNSAIARSFSAVNTISSDLPEPWKCQMSPCFTLPCSTRCTIRFVAWNCWNRAITLILRCFESVANTVKKRRKSSMDAGASTPFTASLTTSSPIFAGASGSVASSRHGPHSSTGMPTDP